MKLLVQLFHGRTDPTEEMDDWGTDGPIFIVDYFHVTYWSDIKLADGEYLRIVEDDLIYYDGVYYGDISTFIGNENDPRLKHRIRKWKKEKAEPK